MNEIFSFFLFRCINSGFSTVPSRQKRDNSGELEEEAASSHFKKLKVDSTEALNMHQS